MLVRGIYRLAFASKPLRCGAFVGAVLITAFGAPVASATPGLPVIDGPTPSLPSSVPPQPSVTTVPQEQVQVPTVPHVPAVKAPVASAPGTAPNPTPPGSVPSDDSTKPSSPGVHLPAASEIASGTKRSAGISTPEAHQPTILDRSGGEGADRHRASPSGSRAGSLESAKAAPRLLAYVWPAIALPAGELLRALQTQWEAATSLPVPGVPDLLSKLAGVGGADRAAATPERPAALNPSPADSRDTRLPSGGAISFLVFIGSCLALVALLIFTLTREFRAMRRWQL